MKLAVYDTYVTKKDGSVMHFDILVPDNLKDEKVIFNFGKEYLKNKGQGGQPLTAKECTFCHIANAPEALAEKVEKNGYHIFEMDGCE